MAVIFNEKYGGVDIDLVQNIFNGKFITNWFDTILNRYMFYADMKWIFSIYTPPRFWEAAGAHTINLSPERLNDQEQFPAIKDGVHYLSYKEDFSNIKEVIEGITQEQFEFITQNCFAIYKEWILPNKYSISDKLLQYIIDGIERSVQ